MKFLGLDLTTNTQNANTQNGIRIPHEYVAPIMPGMSTYNRTSRSDLENSFAPVNQIISDIYSREFFPTIDKKRIPKAQANGWWAIDNPNDAMSSKKFITTLISGYLILPSIAFVVWIVKETKDGKKFLAPGGLDGEKIKAESVAGFSILPKNSRMVTKEGKKFWKLQTVDGFIEVGESSVVELKYGILPEDGITGISPGSASHDEAQIVDFTSQQQRAFFENNANPTRHVTIRSRTPKEGASLEAQFTRKFMGSMNSGGTIFTHVASNSLESAQNMEQPSVAVETISPVNTSLGVTDIRGFAQATIDANMGVSPVIYGKVDAASYDTEKTARSRFYAQVDNIMTRFFDDFVFGLNRIVEGINWSIGYEVRNIEVAGEALVQAQARVANSQAYNSLIDRGDTPKQASEKLGLPSEWACGDIKPISEFSTSPTTTVVNDNKKKIKKHATGELTKVKDRKPEQIEALKDIYTRFAKRKLRKYAKTLTTNVMTPEDQVFMAELTATLREIGESGGQVASRQLAQKIKNVLIAQNYELSGNSIAFFNAQANLILARYNEQIALMGADAVAKGISPSSLVPRLITDKDGSISARIDLMAISNQKEAFQHGQLDIAGQIQSDTGVTISKVWRRTSNNSCEFCEAMDGTEAGAMDVFPLNKEAREAPTGTLVSEFSDGTTPDAHARCQCVFEWRIS